MAFFTSGGLKVRLDPYAIENMASQSGVMLDLSEACADVELWARLPQAMCAVAALVAALWTRSFALTVLGSIVAFAVGNISQQFVYSPFLRILFPQTLGGWIIAAPASIACAVYLFVSGHAAAAFAQLAVVFCTITGFANILLIALTPIRLCLHWSGLTPKIGDIELAFVAILNGQASHQQAELDWRVYDRERDFSSFPVGDV